MTEMIIVQKSQIVFGDESHAFRNELGYMFWT